MRKLTQQDATAVRFSITDTHTPANIPYVAHAAVHESVWMCQCVSACVCMNECVCVCVSVSVSVIVSGSVSVENVCSSSLLLSNAHV